MSRVSILNTILSQLFLFMCLLSLVLFKVLAICNYGKSAKTFVYMARGFSSVSANELSCHPDSLAQD